MIRKLMTPDDIEDVTKTVETVETIEYFEDESSLPPELCVGGEDSYTEFGFSVVRFKYVVIALIIGIFFFVEVML